MKPEFDTGVSQTDLLSNISKPTVSFTSEPGLTVAVHKNSIDGPSLVKGTVYDAYEGSNGFYQLVFFDDLDSGDYVVSLKDDAGNLNIIEEGSTKEVFSIDTDSPIFIGSIDLGKDDQGRFSDDKLTNHPRPELNFNAEKGLNLSFEYSNGTESSSSFTPNFSVEIDPYISLSSEEKEIFDGLNLSSVGNYDPYPSVPI